MARDINRKIIQEETKYDIAQASLPDKNIGSVSLNNIALRSNGQLGMPPYALNVETSLGRVLGEILDELRAIKDLLETQADR